LKTLPGIALSFSRGELPYSKVKAFALKTTAARVEERCRELRCGRADSVVEASRTRRGRSRGTMTFTVVGAASSRD